MNPTEPYSLSSLHADERPIMLALAIAATGMARSHLMTCLRAIGARRANGRGFNSENLGVTLQAMGTKKVIDYTTSYARPLPEVAWPILLASPRHALDPLVAALRQVLPLTPERHDALQRELNLALLDRDEAALVQLVAWARQHKPFALGAGRAGVLGDLPAAVVDHVRASPRVLAVVLAEVLRIARQQMRREDEVAAELAELFAIASAQPIPAIAAHELVRQLILRARLDDATAILRRHETPDDDATSAALACWLAVAKGLPIGDDERQRLSATPTQTASALTATLPGPEHLVVALARIAKRLPAVKRATALAPLGLELGRELELIESVLRNGELEPNIVMFSSYRQANEERAWRAVTVGLARSLASEATPADSGQADVRKQALAAGHCWLADELAALSAEDERASALRALFTPVPPWLRKLERLEKALASLRPASQAEAPSKPEPIDKADTRLVWMLEAETYGVTVHPREQRRDARGSWSKGRRVALEHLFGAQPTYAPLTEADRAVCAYIREDVTFMSGYRNVAYVLSAVAAFQALAAHPHVRWLDIPPPRQGGGGGGQQREQGASNPDSQRIAFRDAEPVLQVVRAKDGFVIRFEPRVQKAGDFLRKTGPYELTRVRARAPHEALGAIVGDGLTLPRSQAERVERLVAALGGVVALHHDLVADAASDRVASDVRPVVRLAPLAQGLSVRVQVLPLGADGPAFSPGQGARMVSAVRAAATVAAERDLAAERARFDELVAACPALQAGEGLPDDEWRIDDMATSLELLIQLEALGESIVVTWPTGKALKVLGSADAKALRLKIGSATGGWFALSGELVVGEHVLEIGELLRLVADSPSRFVTLSPGRFVALTARLREQLGALSALAEPRRGHVGLHPWAGTALDALAEEAGSLEAVPAWGESVRAREEARRFVPCVPSTLKASLRDYQRDGFSWLARLARLGVGACLADDMGLGKTLQTLALLLHRAAEGAQLVVCPSSVVGVWVDEAARFAPTLRLAVLGAAAERARPIEEVGPFDVLVVSFGLLVVESQALAGRRWETVVLDEAQAIKNAETQRASAAYALDAAFRVVLTGTPIENSLGDLWALFHFMLPGYLGTRARFIERFVRPEQLGQAGQAGQAGADGRARQARHTLKQIVQPLLLRRTKGEVLDELPARTEMVLRVTLSAREAALYEALRQRALTSLAAHAAEPSGQQRVRVLAEITRLRRACCHPRLVLSDATSAEPFALTDAAKLTALAELVQNLREGGHRALVYSQFVDHLQVVREWLEGQAIRFQYLDGSTPQKQRQERVRAFQAGDGELFLISLRAGGTGLNLTGADFVVHLDPWWNPAVEDQASDRVYRIGQERPVTIVRLVVRGSIEERIMELHATKRELADELLAGADGAAKLDVDGLVALLAGRSVDSDPATDAVR